MNKILLKSLEEPGVQLFTTLTEAQLRNRLEPKNGIFICESPKVISVALSAGMEPVALLTEERHLAGDAAPLLPRLGDIPIYTGERTLLERLTGYTLTRGVLCAMKRPVLKQPEDIMRKAKRVVVIEGVTDTTNIGAIFRAAAALGIDGVLLTTNSCDPLNRRAVRVSMGSVFLVPWAWMELSRDISGQHEHYLERLRQAGFTSCAMALRHDALELGAPQLRETLRLAIIMGTEGDGLPAKTIDGADHVVRIPMHHGVDSLNVAAAAAVTFWELCKS